MSEETSAEIVIVPHAELQADLLHAVVESFVLREGTDYGERELTLEDKVARLVDQLRRNEAHIVFDPQSQSITILPGRVPSSAA